MYELRRVNNEYKQGIHGWEDYPQGLSRRDYFAAAALTGLLASERDDYCYASNDHETREQQAARNAYEMADAMLVQRAKD